MTLSCPNKELCGSCSWSHIPYEKQLQQKLSDINGSFKLKGLDINCEDIIPSPRLAHYRNRMDFVIDFEGRVGLRQKGKWWRVIDGHPCFISDLLIEEKFFKVREWVKKSRFTFYDRKSHQGFLRYAVIRTNLAGEVMVIIVTSATENLEEEKLALESFNELSSTCNITNLLWSVNHTITDVSSGDEIIKISGDDFLIENIAGFKYKISPHAFFQTNSYGAKELLKAVGECVDEGDEGKLVDLYCGCGFFAVALHSKFEQVTGVESCAASIEDAKFNCDLNGVKINFFAEKSEDLKWEHIEADVVVVDPPRSGMHDRALEKLLSLAAKKIIYVSCNHKNFAREAVQLLKRYSLSSIKAIDMFPHTPHVEVVSCLTKI